jgi:hypothetical protein
MYENELVCFETCALDVTDEHNGLLVEAIRKVHRNRHLIAHAPVSAIPL